MSSKISLLLIFILIGLFVAIILLSFFVFKIEINSSIKNLFPYDKNMELTIGLASKSPVSDKVILFVQVNPDEKDKLKEYIDVATDKLNKTLSQLNDKFNENVILKNSIPNANEVNNILKYVQSNSLLLYPYEVNENPFTKQNIQKGLKAKENFVLSMPFTNPDRTFFLDPLMMSGKILKIIRQTGEQKFNPQYNGIVAENGLSYIKIFKANFFPEDYAKGKVLYLLHREINSLSKKNKTNIFLFSAHLYYYESYSSIQREVSIIFIISILATLFIFFFFFKKIHFVFYGFMPIVGGLSVTFLLIALFKHTFGGIALAFGATTAGIAIDYTIHYLTKRNLYSTVKEIREKIGFSLLLGFVTTIASFCLLIFSNIVSLREIALFGIFAISGAFFLSWFVLQPLLPPGQKQIKIRKINFPLFKKKMLIVWLIIIVILIVPAFFIKFEDNIKNLDKKHTTLSKELQQIQKQFHQSTDSIFIAFEGENTEDVIHQSLQAYWLLQKKMPKAQFFTPALLAPDRDTLAIRKKFIKEKFKRQYFYFSLSQTFFTQESFNNWINNIQNIDNLKLSEIPVYLKGQIDSQIVEWKNKYYLLVSQSQRDQSRQIYELLKNNKIECYLIDIVQNSKDGLLKFEKAALKLLLLSMVIIFLILFISYRNILFALTSLLPSIAAIISVFAVTVLTGNKFNIMHITALILLLGIGVDYGIFMTTLFKRGANKEEINATIRSIFISALTTIFGFGVLIFSTNLSVFSLGLSMFVGIIVAFITAYIVTPNLLKKRDSVLKG